MSVEDTKNAQVEPCKIVVGFNAVGMVIFKCEVHSTWKGGGKGERLTFICIDRLRKCLEKLIEEVNE
jgi:hypothetical protein